MVSVIVSKKNRAMCHSEVEKEIDSHDNEWMTKSRKSYADALKEGEKGTRDYGHFLKQITKVKDTPSILLTLFVGLVT